MLSAVFPGANAQSLFESSQSGNHENLVSTSLILGGFLRSVSYLSRSTENDNIYFQGLYAQAGLVMDARAGSIATAHAELRFKYGSEFREAVSETDLREAYVTLTAGPASFRLGKMINLWGKGSVFNPSHSLAPMDPTVRSPEENDLYNGVWGLEAGVNLGSFSRFTLNWNPLYDASVLLIEPLPLPDYLEFSDSEFPGLDLRESSYGMRYELFTSIGDMSIYWFEGYNHWPGLVYKSMQVDFSTLQPTSLVLYPKAYELRKAALDLSLPAGALIFRGEGAWQQPGEEAGSNEYIPFAELSYTVEAEWSGTHLNLIAGYYGKFIMDFEPSGAEASLRADPDQFLDLISQGTLPTPEEVDQMVRDRIGAFNRLYNYQLEEYYHSIFLAGKIILWHEQLEVDLPVVYNATSEEWMLRPGITYMPADGIRIRAGYEGLFGPEESLYDLAGPTLNSVFLSFKLSF